MRNITTRALSVLTFLAVGSGGCFDLEARLDAHGGARLRFRYVLDPGSTPDAQLAIFTTPHVHPEGITVERRKLGSLPVPIFGHVATIDLAVSDVEWLKEVKPFERVEVTRETRQGLSTLHIRVVHPTPSRVEDNGQLGPRIALALPGSIRDARPKPQLLVDERVIWQLRFVDLLDTIDLQVTYATPHGEAGVAP